MSTSLTNRQNGRLSARTKAEVRQIDDRTAVEAAEIAARAHLAQYETHVSESSSDVAMSSVVRTCQNAIRHGQASDPACAAACSRIAAGHVARVEQILARAHQPRISFRNV